ncbi:MAG: glutathione peroxidase [Polyangiaceae bacterium]
MKKTALVLAALAVGALSASVVSCQSNTQPSAGNAPVATSTSATASSGATQASTPSTVGAATTSTSTCSPAAKPGSFYSFKATTIDHSAERSLCDFRGKVVLVVNVASKCGFTYQYKGLEQLYEKYRDKGLEVVGFPCNQFGGQEPASDGEIKSFCSTTYNVSFPMMAKVDVNGPSASPIYAWLKSQPNGGGSDLEWNFTKFVVDRKGNVAGRFASNVEPNDTKLVGVIEKAISESQ